MVTLKWAAKGTSESWFVSLCVFLVVCEELNLQIQTVFLSSLWYTNRLNSNTNAHCVNQSSLGIQNVYCNITERNWASQLCLLSAATLYWFPWPGTTSIEYQKHSLICLLTLVYCWGQVVCVCAGCGPLWRQCGGMLWNLWRRPQRGSAAAAAVHHGRRAVRGAAALQCWQRVYVQHLHHLTQVELIV